MCFEISVPLDPILAFTHKLIVFVLCQRIESSGAPNKIHLSQETADLLVAAGKAQWLRARKDKVNAKGKGELQTYLVSIGSGSRIMPTAGSIGSSLPS